MKKILILFISILLPALLVTVSCEKKKEVTPEEEYSEAAGGQDVDEPEPQYEEEESKEDIPDEGMTTDEE